MRYVMASRRSGKFRETEKVAARKAIDLTVNILAAGMDIVNDSQPDDLEARRVVVFESDPEEISARRTELPDDVILEPEILHDFDAIRTMDFLSAEPGTLDGPVGRGSDFDVRIRGNGANLRGAKVSLFLRGLGGLRRELKDSTRANGRVSFNFDPFWTPSALMVVPAGGFWPSIVRGPVDGVTVDCPVLRTDGPLDWWHKAVGVDKHLKTRGKGIRVGVVDTGIGPHPCLSHVNSVGAFISGDFDSDGGADVDSHGTHVSGTIGARPEAAGQYAGIAPGVNLLSARVFPAGGLANQADIANAIDSLSSTFRADIINLSLGSKIKSDIGQDAIQDAQERGTLCICAAANSSGAVEYPAAFPETVAVSAIGQLGTAPSGSVSSSRLPVNNDEFGTNNLFLANFSCRGPEITVGGPGVGVIATVPERFGLQAPYGAMDGTSMASPAVCAALAAALAKSKAYKAMPRDQTRVATALQLLVNRSLDIGLAAELQGRGMPQAP